LIDDCLNQVDETSCHEQVLRDAFLDADPDAQVIAYVRGNAVTELPEDLYIPPEALRIFLDAFQGPLDLLLYLIKKHNLDILDIPVAKITEQYVQYIELMQDLKVDLAAEYLVMAAMLTEIKSRMLLPRESEEVIEDDPRAKLVRQLQLYERLKIATEKLDALPRLERDLFSMEMNPPDLEQTQTLPEVLMKELVLQLQAIMSRQTLLKHHYIQREPLSIRERMTIVLEKLEHQSFLSFNACFSREESKMGVVVTFIAILELMKQSIIEIVQATPFSPIHLHKR
jgi:segregation and condensation protein A